MYPALLVSKLFWLAIGSQGTYIGADFGAMQINFRMCNTIATFSFASQFFLRNDVCNQ